MKLLITGAAGFIGTNFCLYVKRKGHHVVALDNFSNPQSKQNLPLLRHYGISVGKIDIRKPLSGTLTSVDAIVHLASHCSTPQSFKKPYEDFLDNALGTLNILEFAKNNGRIPIIYASTINGSNYNGIISYYREIEKNLCKTFRFETINFSFLQLNKWRKLIVNFTPIGFSDKLIYSSDFGLNYTDVEKISNAQLVHYWHPEFAAVNTNIKYIVTCLGIELYPEQIRNSGTKFFEKVFDNALMIHAVSNSTKQLIYAINPKKSKFWSKKIQVIYPCVNINSFYNSVRKKLGKTIFVGTIARFVDEKNLEMIVNALYNLKKNRQLSFRYLLAGAGPNQKKIISKLNLYKIPYNYLGDIKNNNKINFYKKNDILVLPAFPTVNKEGIGIAYFEACSAGKPIVTSKVSDQSPDPLLPGEYADHTDVQDISNIIVNVIKN